MSNADAVKLSSGKVAGGSHLMIPQSSIHSNDESDNADQLVDSGEESTDVNMMPQLSRHEGYEKDMEWSDDTDRESEDLELNEDNEKERTSGKHPSSGHSIDKRIESLFSIDKAVDDDHTIQHINEDEAGDHICSSDKDDDQDNHIRAFVESDDIGSSPASDDNNDNDSKLVLEEEEDQSIQHIEEDDSGGHTCSTDNEDDDSGGHTCSTDNDDDHFKYIVWDESNCQSSDGNTGDDSSFVLEEDNVDAEKSVFKRVVKKTSLERLISQKEAKNEEQRRKHPKQLL